MIALDCPDERYDESEWITASELELQGFTPEDVARLCPWAIERTALDGQPCWLLSDLEALWTSSSEGDE